MDEPQAEQLVETLDHCGAPRAAGGADTSQAWYQLRARKRATFAKKIVIPSLTDTSRATLSCTGGDSTQPVFGSEIPDKQEVKPDPTTYARRTRAPPRESGAGLRDSVDAIVVCHVSEITSK